MKMMKSGDNLQTQEKADWSGTDTQLKTAIKTE